MYKQPENYSPLAIHKDDMPADYGLAEVTLTGEAEESSNIPDDVIALLTMDGLMFVRHAIAQNMMSLDTNGADA